RNTDMTSTRLIEGWSPVSTMKISIGCSSWRTRLAMTVASIGRPFVRIPTCIVGRAALSANVILQAAYSEPRRGPPRSGGVTRGGGDAVLRAARGAPQGFDLGALGLDLALQGGIEHLVHVLDEGEGNLFAHARGDLVEVASVVARRDHVRQARATSSQ